MTIEVWKGDITKLEVDAIVNTISKRLLMEYCESKDLASNQRNTNEFLLVDDKIAI